VKLSLALAVKSSGSNRSSFCSSRGSRSPQLSQTRLIDRPREWQCCSSSGLYQGPLAQKSIFSLRFVFSLVRSRCYFVPFSVAGQTHIGKAKRENEKRRKAAAAAATAPTLSLSLSSSFDVVGRLLSGLLAFFVSLSLLFSSLLSPPPARASSMRSVCRAGPGRPLNERRRPVSACFAWLLYLAGNEWARAAPCRAVCLEWRP
jgi:hypothetical protein